MPCIELNFRSELCMQLKRMNRTETGKLVYQEKTKIPFGFSSCLMGKKKKSKHPSPPKKTQNETKTPK